MERLNIDQKQTQIFNKYGVFFAFDHKQYHEQAKPGIQYAHVGNGMFCQSGTCQEVFDALEALEKENIAWELANNTKKDIIWYELANHECQLTMSYKEIIELMEPYGITKDDIKAEWPGYMQHCIEHDYF